MNVLIIEDDEHKLSELRSFISQTFELEQVRTAKSLQSGMRCILEARPNLIFLDMTMRNFDRTLTEEGGRPHPFAGREILRQMQRSRIDSPVVVVTHFDRFGEESDYMTLEELVEELSEKFSNYLGTVHYRSNVDDWKPSLLKAVGRHLPRRRL